MDRRDFISLVGFSLASQTLLGQDIPKVSIGAWPLDLPNNTINQLPLSGDLAVIVRGVAQTVRFAHLYVKISLGSENYYIHGFPCDPVTKERRDFNNLQGSILQVTVLTEKEHQFEAKNHCHRQLDEYPLPMSANISGPHILAEAFDMAAAINDARLTYQPFTLSRQDPPVNSNAVAAAMLGVLHACGMTNCPQLETLFPGYFVPGVNRGLPERLDVKKAYQAMETAGADMPKLADDYRKRYMMPRPMPRNATSPCVGH